MWGDISGAWSLNQAKYPELPDNQENDLLNNIDMTGNVLLMHMNNDWQDTSGNNNHGTAGNGAIFTADSKFGTHAGIFDGVWDI